VNLRHLVPALALAAVTAAPAMAADAVPAVSFAGWVDTIFSFSDSDREDDVDNDGNATATAKDESKGALGFTSAASIKAMWKVTDALSAKVNLWFNPDFAEVQMREAYFAWAINDTVTWSMGKYIDHIGWLSAEPTGLYTTNASLIGYTAIYGNDVLGTSIAVAPKDSPFSGSFHVVNGYFTGADATNPGLFANRNSDSRENTDLGFGLDLIFNLPDNKGSINLEFAYDMGSDTNANLVTPADGDLGGDVFLVGLNATVTPVKPLLIGAEIQYLTAGKGEDVAGADVGEDIKRLQGLLLANYAIEGASVPMSVTGMIQYITIDSGTDDDESRLGLAAALLTNPLGSSNFGLNFEIGYFTSDNIGGSPAADDKGIEVSVEGLVTF
jgi:hypothetical protein